MLLKFARRSYAALLGPSHPPITLTTTLGAVECKACHKQATHQGWLQPLFEERIDGWQRKNRLYLTRARPFITNSFKPILVAKLEEALDGTRLYCEFKMLVFVRIFMHFWFGALLLSLPFTLFEMLRISTVNSNEELLATLLVLPAPIFIILVGSVIVAVGRRLSETDPEFLLDYLKTMLDARETS